MGLCSCNSNSKPDLSSWKILIVDDEDDVHRITKLAMLGITYDELPIEFLSAYSGKEACEIMATDEDIALVILDVVMETDTAGLDVASFIRRKLNNQLVRIVLRTGQPGQVPEDEIMEKYDINDYKEKTELSTPKLRTMIRSNLRAYNDKRMLYVATGKILQLNRLSHKLISCPDLKTASMYVYESLFLHLNRRRPTVQETRNHIYSFINPLGDHFEFHNYYSGESIDPQELPSPIIE